MPNVSAKNIDYGTKVSFIKDRLFSNYLFQVKIDVSDFTPVLVSFSNDLNANACCHND